MCVSLLPFVGLNGNSFVRGAGYVLGARFEKTFCRYVVLKKPVSLITPVPTANDNLACPFNVDRPVFDKAKVLLARRLEIIVANGDALANGEYFFAVFGHKKPVPLGDGEQLCNENTVTALSSAEEHHPVNII